MRDRIAKAVCWLVWSKGAIQTLTFLTTLAVARLLDPSDYGLLALAGIWTGIIAMLSELGLGSAIIQFRDLEERELNSSFWLCMGVAVLGYLGLCAASPHIASWFGSPLLSDILRIAGLSLPLVAIRVVPDSLLRKELAFDKISKAEIVATLVTIPVLLGMAWTGAGVWSLVIGNLVASMVQTVLTVWFVGWYPGLRMGSKRWREFLKYGIETLGSRAGWTVYAQTDSFVLGKVSGDLMLGFYTMAKEIAIIPVTKLSVLINQLAAPVMAELQTDLNGMRASFLKVLRLVTCLTVPLCAGVGLVAEDLVSVALTDKWLPAVTLLQVFSVCMVFRSLEVLFPPVLFARYRTTFMVWWTTVLLLVMPIAFLVGAVWGGGIGVALTWALVYPFIMVWMVQEALNELKISWQTIGTQIRTVATAALIMVTLVSVVQWALPDSDVTDRSVRLVIAAAVGALVYSAALLWQGGVMVREIAEVGSWILGRNRAVPVAK